MDDICIGCHTAEETENAMVRLAQIFNEANMPLHKSRVTGEPSPDQKVLGLQWSTESDCLAVTVPDLPSPISRRELLSAISKTFDPVQVGVLSSWVIQGKVLFQQTWKEPVGT